MIVSVDIGASATKAVVRGGRHPEPVVVRVQDQPSWPTALVLGRDRELITGPAARNLRDAGPYRKRYFAGIKQQINLAGPVEPLYRELHFASGDTQPLVRGVTAILAHALAEVTERYGTPGRLVLSHPVMWGEERKAVLAEAAAALGFPAVTLIGEAEAVGAHAAGVVGTGGTFAVLDLGASTFDLALLRARPGTDPPEVLYAAGRLTGGDDFDTKVLELVRESATPAGRRTLTELAAGEPDLLRAEAERVKRVLSEAQEARFAVRELDIPVDRDDFTEAIAPLVGSCLTVATEAIAACGASPELIVLSGGGARVPYLREHVESLAACCGAELVTLTGEENTAAVALGAALATDPDPDPLSGPVTAPAALRPFLLTPRAAALAHPGAEVVGVRGGLLELGRDSAARLHPARPGPPGPPLGPLPPLSRVAADPASGRVLLASPSPAFTLSGLTLPGGLARPVTFGRLAALPTARRETPVTALACGGPLVAWTETGRPATLVDTRDWRWHRLELNASATELAFTATPALLARDGARLLLFDLRGLPGAPSSAPAAALDLPAGAVLAVEPEQGTVCVADAAEIVCWRTGPDGFAPGWRRALRTRGALAFTRAGDRPALIAYDAHDLVYRALDAATGRQLALRDAARLDPPDALHPSPDPGVVHPRTGTVLGRLVLSGARP